MLLTFSDNFIQNDNYSNVLLVIYFILSKNSGVLVFALSQWRILLSRVKAQANLSGVKKVKYWFQKLKFLEYPEYDQALYQNFLMTQLAAQ